MNSRWDTVRTHAPRWSGLRLCGATRSSPRSTRHRPARPSPPPPARPHTHMPHDGVRAAALVAAVHARWPARRARAARNVPAPHRTCRQHVLRLRAEHADFRAAAWERGGGAVSAGVVAAGARGERRVAHLGAEVAGGSRRGAQLAHLVVESGVLCGEEWGRRLRSWRCFKSN